MFCPINSSNRVTLTSCNSTNYQELFNELLVLLPKKDKYCCIEHVVNGIGINHYSNYIDGFCKGL